MARYKFTAYRSTPEWQDFIVEAETLDEADDKAWEIAQELTEGWCQNEYNDAAIDIELLEVVEEEEDAV